MSADHESDIHPHPIAAARDEDIARPPGDAAVTPPSAAAERPAGAGPAVLIVDDNERLARTVATYMEMDGFASQAAFSAEEALGAVAATRFVAAVIDINMPGMDGIEVCRRIVALAPGVRVLMLTGRDADADRHKAAVAGARRLLSKPISLSTLCDEVRQVLAE